MPATPFTLDWPSSLPSVPTSRATRVASEANELSRSTIVLTTSRTCRKSPQTDRLLQRLRPRAISAVGQSRSRTRPFTAFMLAAQEPVAFGGCARCRVLPSFPTISASCLNSYAFAEEDDLGLIHAYML